MQLWNKTRSLWALSVLSILGLIGMLVFEGVWDVLMLLVTILPILITVYRARKMSKS